MKKIALALCLTGLAALPAYAQMMDMPMKDMPMMEHMGGEGHAMGMDKMGEAMGMCIANADKIGLSDEQTRKLTPLHREMQKKMVRSRAELKIAEMELMEVMEVKDFDLEKATAAAKKIVDTKLESHLQMLKLMKQARAILTSDQFQKVRKLMEKRMGGKPGMMEMKHHHE